MEGELWPPPPVASLSGWGRPHHVAGGCEPTAGSAREAVPSEAEEKKKKGAGVPLSVYFKEESNVVADLEDAEKKALGELKQLVRDALANREFTGPPPKEEAKTGTEKPQEPSPKAPMADEREAEAHGLLRKTVVPVAVAAAPQLPSQGADHMAPPPLPPVEEVLLWGVPLVGGGEKSDTVLLKFLRARDFKAKEAMAMLKQTVRWREEFGIKGLLQEEDSRMPELEKVVFMQGHDREGHPVCYNVFGEFQDEELYKKVFSDEEKRGRFLRLVSTAAGPHTVSLDLKQQLNLAWPAFCPGHVDLLSLA